MKKIRKIIYMAIILLTNSLFLFNSTGMFEAPRIKKFCFDHRKTVGITVASIGTMTSLFAFYKYKNVDIPTFCTLLSLSLGISGILYCKLNDLGAANTMPQGTNVVSQDANIVPQEVEDAIETIKTAAKNKLHIIMQNFYPDPAEEPLALEELQEFFKNDHTNNLFLLQYLHHSQLVKHDLNIQNITVNNSHTKNFVIIESIINSAIVRIYCALNFKDESSLNKSREEYNKSKVCSIYMQKLWRSVDTPTGNKQLGSLLLSYVSPIDYIIIKNTQQENNKNELKKLLNALYSAIICSEVLCEEMQKNENQKVYSNKKI